MNDSEDTVRSVATYMVNRCMYMPFADLPESQKQVMLDYAQAAIASFLSSPVMQRVQLKLDSAAAATRRQVSGNDTHRLDIARCELNEAVAELRRMKEGKW